MRRFTILPEVDSTSNWVTARLEALRPWHTVRARLQTAGRGRLNRTWFSGKPDHNLAFSMVVPVSKIQPGVISARVGLALYQVLCRYADVKVRWPNDIVSQGQKLAGVLVTLNVSYPHVAVVGIGVNVNNEDFPPELTGVATSLALATGKHTRINRLWLQIWKEVRAMLGETLPVIDQNFIRRYNSVAWPFVKRSEIAEAPLQFQSLLEDGRALCLAPEGPVTLDMAP